MTQRDLDTLDTEQGTITPPSRIDDILCTSVLALFVFVMPMLFGGA